MKNKLLFTAILVTGFAFAFCGTNHLYGQTPKSNMVVKDTTMKYSCPHHPDVISDKLGKCACGMDLVMKDKDKMSKKAKMKEGDMMHDSKDMKHDKKKMMHDTTTMKKGKM